LQKGLWLTAPRQESEPLPEDQTKKAFDFASDASKQLITLSTGVIALTVTFNKDFIGQGATGARGWLVAAWFSFLISILFGCWFLFAVAGTFALTSRPALYDMNTRFPAYLQVVTFVLALLLTVIFGWQAFGASPPSNPKPVSSPIVSVAPTPSATPAPCVCGPPLASPTPAKSAP
jgi:hypothetical protein